MVRVSLIRPHLPVVGQVLVTLAAAPGSDVDRERSCLCGNSGRAGGTRTHNHRFWRPGLCQLSYGPSVRRVRAAPVAGMLAHGGAPPSPECTGSPGVRSNRRATQRRGDPPHGTMAPWSHPRVACPPGSGPSPSPPPSPSTPRRRRSRPPVGRWSASGQASPTSRPPTTSSRPPSQPAATRAGTATPRREASPSSRRRSPPRRCATPVTRSRPARCWSPTAASRPSTTRSRPSSTPATRCCSRRRTGPPTRSRSASPAGCRSRSSPTRPAATSPAVDQLEAALTPRTKALVFVSPSNPTGAVYPPEQVEAIGRWAVERGIWVVTDEIYEHLTYGGATFASMPALVPELADQCVVVNGVAKTYAMTGWRVGWMIGPGRRDQGGDEPPVPRDLQRVQRRAGRCAGRRLRRPLRGGDDARGVRPTSEDDGGDARGDPGRDLPGAARGVLRLPVREGRARPRAPRPAAQAAPPTWPL